MPTPAEMTPALGNTEECATRGSADPPVAVHTSIVAVFTFLPICTYLHPRLAMLLKTFFPDAHQAEPFAKDIFPC